VASVLNASVRVNRRNKRESLLRALCDATLCRTAEAKSVGVNVDRTGGNERWSADVEAVYGGKRSIVESEGDLLSSAWTRALALAARQACPAPVLPELLALEVVRRRPNSLAQ
jgi:hypothetical protein